MVMFGDYETTSGHSDIVIIGYQVFGIVSVLFGGVSILYWVMYRQCTGSASVFYRALYRSYIGIVLYVTSGLYHPCPIRLHPLSVGRYGVISSTSLCGYMLSTRMAIASPK
jgi:hypothetical protein